MKTQVVKKPTIRRALAVALGLTIAVLAAMPASAQHSPSTVYQPPLDRITTFVAASNGRLYDKYYNNGWIWEAQGNPRGALVYRFLNNIST
jgi:hypothetical protein